MKDIEKKINDRLSNAQSNEGIDANDLWENISAEMGLPAKDVEVTPSSKFDFKRFWPLFALLFLCCIGFYFYQNSSSSLVRTSNQATTPNNSVTTNKQSTKGQDQKLQQTATSSTEINQAIAPQPSAAPPKTTIASETSLPKQADHIGNSNNTSNAPNSNNTSTSPVKPAQNQTPNSRIGNTRLDEVVDGAPMNEKAIYSQEENVLAERRGAAEQNLPIENEPKSAGVVEPNGEAQADKIEATQRVATDQVEQAFNDNVVLAETQLQQSLSESVLSGQPTIPPTAKEQSRNVIRPNSTDLSATIKRMALLEALASKSPGLVYSQQTKEEEEFKLLEKILDRKNAHFSLGLFAGTHVLKNTFKGSSAAEDERANLLNEAYKVQLGQQVAIEVNFHLNKKLYLSTGVAYQRSNSQFNLVQTWDTTMVHPNVSTGELIAAQAIRTIRHRNQLSSLVLPVSLGYQRELGRWGIGAQGGLALNFLQSQSGKAVNANNQISIYPNSENALIPVSKTFLSYHLRPYVYFRSSKKLSWQLRTDFAYQQYGQSNYYGLKHGAFLSGVNIGVVFKP